jgi:hypothetical protein
MGDIPHVQGSLSWENASHYDLHDQWGHGIYVLKHDRISSEAVKEVTDVYLRLTTKHSRKDHIDEQSTRTTGGVGEVVQIQSP